MFIYENFYGVGIVYCYYFYDEVVYYGKEIDFLEIFIEDYII